MSIGLTRLAIKSLLSWRWGPVSPAIWLASVFIAVLASQWHDATDSKHWEFIALLFPPIAVLLGVNVIGLSISVNQFGQAANIRRIGDDLRNSTAELFSKYYNAHPRDQKTLNVRFLRTLLKRTNCSEIRLSTIRGNRDYFIYRPNWDGAWYQISRSPFSQTTDSEERPEVAALHEAVICLVAIVRQTVDMRKVCRGREVAEGMSNGSIWFLDDLTKIVESLNLGTVGPHPPSIKMEDALSVISVGLRSSHYWLEEFENRTADQDWQPRDLMLFLCFFSRYCIWFGFAWNKLQKLRVIQAQRYHPKCLESPSEALIKKTGMHIVSETHGLLSRILGSSLSEYGVASRLWRIRKGALPGILWTLCYIILAYLIWPTLSLWMSGYAQQLFFVLTYGFGMIAIMESIIFTTTLVWNYKEVPPFDEFGSKL